MSAVMEQDPVARYARLIETERGARQESLPDWLETLTQRAGEAFRKRGFPDRRNENWRYTSLSGLLEQPFVPAERNRALLLSDIDDAFVRGLDAWRIVIVNGRVEPSLSALQDLPRGVWIGGLGAALRGQPERLRAHLGQAAQAGGEVFSDINLAALVDGAVIWIDEDVVLERPIELLHLTVGADDPQVAQPRHLIVMDRGAKATVIERYESLGQSLYFNNVALEIDLQPEAELVHYRVQQESANAFHVHGQFLRQYRDSRYVGLGVALGGAWSRADWHVDFAEPGAECDLKGLYVVGDGQLADNHLHMHHRVPECTSRENFRGVLNGKGRAVFDGRIVVYKEAQKSDARLSNNNLLLSRQAEIDTKPQLEIFADDVVCSHGTTVGQIDPQMLFYLRSRGIPEPQARRMICLGFAHEVLDGCTVPALGAHLQTTVGQRLAKEVNV